VYSKGKAVPLQAWCGPGGSRKFRFPDFMTMAQYGGKVSVHSIHSFSSLSYDRSKASSKARSPLSASSFKW